MAGYKKGKAIRLTKHFKTTEFDCKGKGCCNTTIINAQLVTLLEKLRNHFNKPVYINSGYRCTKHNKAVGGASNSQHTHGKAVDIVVKGVNVESVAAYAEKIGFKGIGRYSSFTHVDTRNKRAHWRG